MTIRLIIRTVNEVVDLIGEPRLKELTSASDNVIDTWRRVGAFPARTHHVITKELARYRRTAPPRLFTQLPHPSDRAA